MKPAKIVWVVALAAIVFGCENPSSTKDETGTLKVRSYSDGYADPSTISAESPINAILDVTYPDGSKRTVVTDELGFYDFGAVPAGTYEIKPRYLDDLAPTRISVGKGEAVSKTVLLPYIEIAYYLFDPDTAPVNGANVRKALSLAVVRQDIADASGGTNAPLASCIPARLAGPWSAAAHAHAESLGEARTTLGNGAADLAISYNDNVAVNAPIAAKVRDQWQAIGNAVTVSLSAYSWDDFVQKRDVNKSFQAARGGWGYDSNNPLPLFAAQVFLETAEYASLLQAAEADLARGDFGAFDADIVALNDYLVDNCLLIPLYQNQ